ncbi:non-ribosomal peptide synthetase [Pseudoalteromonas sp. MMG005]|uniref:non-ribosomal peptide synthetase n=1 Tax=Pseudoalteromonas sp. MMG005 TaxID=2822682 RepID=UPI001B39D4A2|nr:non-ribosomal peptide synthetase [Pseudoalteromonas sp. MMG005]MBQ4845992.1 amino acid adenylation domain-containing protein [Pseudoalteromonas sp. MMG005]
MKDTQTPSAPVNTHSTQDIAIVGLSLRFPGALTKEQFWHNLNNKVSSITEIPKKRWDWKKDYDPAPKKHEQKIISKWGGFIDNIDGFDASFFAISPTEAQSMDPQQRLSLELAWACFEDAGLSPSTFKNTKTGVYLGCSNTDYQEFSTGNIDPHFLTGMSTGVFANRISHYFNFQGPSETVDTACSSSLVAIHKALNDFKTNDISAALVGGVNLLITKSRYVSFSKLGVLSPKGRCKTLDADADGYVRGEGLGMLLLLPLDKAREANANIYGIIKGSSIGHSGKTNTLTSPSPFSQSRVIQQAHESAGISSDQISFVELHGTGTKLGDPLEIQGLKRAFRATKAKNSKESTCYLSTVKTNIGHLESAAGIAGVIKVQLSFANNAISPLQNFTTLNPKISLAKSPFELVTESTPWPRKSASPRIAGVSSFGFAGVNAHVILQEPPAYTAVPCVVDHENIVQSVFVLSAKNKRALHQRASALLAFIEEALNDDKSNAQLTIQDLAYTLQVGRDAMAYRVGFVASSLSEAVQQLHAYLTNTPDHWCENIVDKHTLTQAEPWPEPHSDACSHLDLSALLTAWTHGYLVDWEALYTGFTPSRVSLPSYPFSHKQYWITQTESVEKLIPNSTHTLHPLLHTTVPAMDELVFTATFNGQEFFFADHKVSHQAVLPGVCSLEMIVEAIRQSHNMTAEHIVELKNISWLRPIALEEHSPQTSVYLSLWEDQSTLTFELWSHLDDNPQVYVKGNALLTNRLSQPTASFNLFTSSTKTHWPDLAFKDSATHPELIEHTKAEIYNIFEKAGINYGTAFQGLHKIQKQGDELLAQLLLDKCYCKGFNVSPTILDSALQSLMAFSDSEELALPFALEHIAFTDIAALSEAFSANNKPTSNSENSTNTQVMLWVHATKTSNNGDSVKKFNLTIYTENAKACVRFTGFSTRSITASIDIKLTENALETSLPSSDITNQAPNAQILATVTPCWVITAFDDVKKTPLSNDLLQATLWDYQGPAHYKPPFTNNTQNDIQHSETAVHLNHLSNHLIWLARDEFADPLAFFKYIKSLLRSGYGEKALTITLVTLQTQRVHCEQVNPQGAGLIGLLQSIAQEYPLWHITIVDMPTNLFDCSPVSQTDILWQQVVTLAPAFYAYRSSQWYAFDIASHHYQSMGATQETAQFPNTSGQCAYRQNGVYVILGGAGGLGYAFSEWLIRTYDAQLIWLGRREKNNDIQRALTQLSNLGKTPVYYSVDAGDKSAMQTVLNDINATFKHIHGVIHSILQLNDQSIAKMNEAQFISSYHAKQQTGDVALELFKDIDLDFFLFFSSLQSFSPAPGQSNYAAGCHYLDSLAQSYAQKMPIKVINWGYWGSIGIVSDAFYKNKMAKQGIGSIEVDEGMQALAQFMQSPLAQVGVIKLAQNTLTHMTKHYSYSADKSLLVNDALSNTFTSRVPYDVSNPSTDNTQILALLRHALIKAQWNTEDKRTAALCQLPAYFSLWWQETQTYLTDAELLVNSEIASAEPANTDILDDTYNEALASQNPLLAACLAQLPDILSGNQKATDVVFPQGTLTLVESVYQNNAQADYANRVLVEQVQHYLTHTNVSTINVLEIGAGTGGTTHAVLPILDAWSVGEYAYTDLSQAFFNHAKARFQNDYPFLHTQYFNVSKPLAAQNIKLAYYDVVIATNVLHATAHIRTTLQNAKACLKPGGALIINEVVEKSLFTQLTFGLLEGWWLSEDKALRIDGSPMLSVEGWQQVLAEEGFTHIHVSTHKSSAQHIIRARSNGQIVQPVDTIQSNNKQTNNSVPPTRSDNQENTIAMTDTHNTTSLASSTLTFTTQTLFAIASNTLGIPQDELDSKESFADYGVDSILAIQMLDDINAQFDLSLPATLLFDYPSIASLSQYIATEHHTHLAHQLPDCAPQAHVNETEPNNNIINGNTNSVASMGEISNKKTYRKPSSIDLTPSNKTAFRAEKTHTPPAPDPDMDNKIAIIGMSGQFGTATNLDEYWSLIQNQQTSVVEQQRWSLNTLAEQEQAWCRYASLLDDISSFDAGFFSITPQEAMYMDPQQRVFLQECYKALDDANMATSVAGKNIGVYLGCAQGDYASLAPDDAPAQIFWGNAGSVIPARVSYFLNLKGPAIAVDTACSSSLVAIHMACQALVNNEISSAIVGGVATLCTAKFSKHAGKAGMLSPDGTCYTFDDRANGFVPGEGVGVLILKRLVDAIADKDHIYGVILGSATNQDGTTSGITAPSSVSQEQLHRDLYNRFNIPPESIGLIEAHGTGTKLGDPIEFQALTRAFRHDTGKKAFCALGSVKTNIGHCLTAAGVAGVIKTLLALKHKSLPPSANFNIGNSHINWQDSPFFVNTQVRDWHVDVGQKRRAAISSFGFSGTNAHLVVEEFTPQPITTVMSASQPFIINLSAKTPYSLREKAQQLHNWIHANSTQCCQAIAYTLQIAREEMEYRMGFVASSTEQIKTELHLFIHKEQGLWKKGEVKQGKTILSALDSSDFNRWVEQREYTKLLSLWVVGAPIDWHLLYGAHTPNTIRLPSYPFAKDRHWLPNAHSPQLTLKRNEQHIVCDKADHITPPNSEMVAASAATALGLEPHTDNNYQTSNFTHTRHSGQKENKTPYLTSAAAHLLHYIPQWVAADITQTRSETYAHRPTHNIRHIITVGDAQLKSHTRNMIADNTTVLHLHALNTTTTDAFQANNHAHIIAQNLVQSYASQLLDYLHSLSPITSPTLLQLVINDSAQASRLSCSDLLLSLSGILKTASLEYTQLHTQLIMFEPNENPQGHYTTFSEEAVIAKINHEATLPQLAVSHVKTRGNSIDNSIDTLFGVNETSISNIVRYHGDNRSILIYTSVNCDDSPDTTNNDEQTPWKEHGVYVISGGTGKLGCIFAQEILHNTANSQIILIGRTPLNNTINAQLNTLNNAQYRSGQTSNAPRVHYVSADISDVDSVSQLLSQISSNHGTITGIIHSAGVIKDCLIQKKRTNNASNDHNSSLNEVFAPKVSGAIALDEASKTLDLDFFVCFSSIAGVLGNLGQANYASANAFVDLFMSHRRTLEKQGKRRGISVSINWPLWCDGGMQIDDITLSMLRTQGVCPLPSETGIHAFYQALSHASKAAQHCFLYGEPDKLSQLWHQPIWPNSTASSNGTLNRAPHNCEEHANSKAQKSSEEVMRYLKSVIYDITQIPPSDLDIYENFREMGFDSIMLMSIAQRVESDGFLSISALPPALLFEVDTIDTLNAYLVTHQVCSSHHQTTTPKINLSKDASRLQDTMALSKAQQGLWLQQKQQPSLTANNVPLVFEVADVNVQTMQNALDWVCQKHPILTVSMREIEGLPTQALLDLTPIISTHLAHCDSKTELIQQIDDTINIPFELNQQLLIRASCWHVNNNGHSLDLMVIVFHHLIIDGVSASLFLELLMSTYTELLHSNTHAPHMLNHQVLTAPEPDLGFFSYLEWEKAMLNSESGVIMQRFWQNELQGTLPVMTLNHVKPPAPMPTHNVSRVNVSIAPHTHSKIEGYLKQTGVSASVFFLTVYQLVLHHFSHSKEMLIGIPVLHRPTTDMSKSLGLFVNQLPLRNIIDTSCTFVELALSNQDKLNSIIRHSGYPFSDIVSAIRTPRSVSHHPIFQVGYAYHNFIQSAWLDHNKALVNTVWDEFQQNPALDLSLEVTPISDQYRATFKFNQAIYHQTTVEQFAQTYQNLIVDILTAGARAHDKAIAEYSVSTANTREMRSSVNNYSVPNVGNTTHPQYSSSPMSIVDLFEKQAISAPHNTALIFADRKVSYGELSQKSNALAVYLRNQDAFKHSLTQDIRVAVCAAPSLELIVTILAILKTGAAYVPIDSNSPPERAEFILNDANPALFLIDSALSFAHESTLNNALKLSISAAQIISLDTALIESAECLSKPSDTVFMHTEPNKVTLVDARNVAYIIYTSGSTGQPKGVLVEHQNVTQLLQNSQQLFNFSAQDTWCLFHSYAFDFSVWEIWGALLNGGKLVVADDFTKKDCAAFADFVAEHKVTVLNQTPSAFYPLMDIFTASPVLTSHLHTIIFGGEALNLSRLKPWFSSPEPMPKLINMYGITETTIHVTAATITSELVSQHSDKSIIGQPLPGYQIHLLDEQQNTVKQGVVGEMYVAGTGVARGYINQPELTAKKFVSRAISSCSDVSHPIRLYRTGDLARLNPHGLLEYVGRSDDQVQIRGHRIELGEVQYALVSLSYVTDAYVLTQHKQHGDVLTAYLITTGPISVTTLRGDLQRCLPEYMVPAFFMFVDKFPLTANGKVDKNALCNLAKNDKAPYAEARIANSSTASTTVKALGNQVIKVSDINHPEPLSQLLTSITQIWLDVLDIDHVGVDDPFFEVGGNSLLANVLSAKLAAQLNVEFSITHIFQYSTVRAMALHIQDNGLTHPVLQATNLVESSLNLPSQNNRQGIHAKSDNTGATAHIPANEQSSKSLTGPLTEPSASPSSPAYYASSIAMIGVSCHYPDADTHQAFWQNLIQGKDFIKRLSEASEASPITWLDSWVDGQDLFDPAFFNISEKNAKTMSYSQRQLLLHAWKAVEDAGYNCDNIPNTGVYISASATDTPDLNLHDKIKDDQFILNSQDYVASTLNQPGTLPTTLSYHLGFTGPSLFVHSNCSSSMSAIALACTALKAKEIDYAIVGAACLYPQRYTGYQYEKGLNFAPDARCKVFDEHADGMIGGNGVSVIVLKRADDAVNDADNIYSMIRDIKVNNDGKDKAGFFAPGIKGQMTVIEQTLRSANINPESISYVEAHGTGTALGDPIEFSALQQVYQQYTQNKQFCGLGAVKSNVGHTDTLAGLTGLLKTSLSLHHKQLPASLHFNTPNPHIDLANSPFYIIDTPQDWHTPYLPRRGAVSSFGIGGTNAHAILEEYVPNNTNTTDIAHSSLIQQPSIVVISAISAPVLKQQMAALLSHLNSPLISEKERVNLAYTLQTGRKVMAHRTGFVVSSLTQLKTQLQNHLHRTTLDKPINTDAMSITQNELTHLFAQHAYDDILQLWLKTGFSDWQFLYQGAKVSKLSLPTAPFALKAYALQHSQLNHSQLNNTALNEITDPKRPADLNEQDFDKSKNRVSKNTDTTALQLKTPTWVAKPPSNVSKSDPISPQHHVVFCEVPEFNISGAITQSLLCSHYTIEQKVEAYATQLLDILQGIAKSKTAAVCQLVLNDRNTTSACSSQSNVYFCLHSLLKTVSLECPTLKTQLILLDSALLSDHTYRAETDDETAQSAVVSTSTVVKSLLTPYITNNLYSDDHVIRYHIENGHCNRYILDYHPVQTLCPTPASQSPWVDKGVYLITGGLGGICTHLIHDLNRQAGHRTVITTGTKPSSHPHVQKQLAALAHPNTSLKYYQVDVTKKMAVILLVRDLLTEFKKLSGIIHAAGVVKDGLFINKDHDTFAHVLGPKVKGVIALDEATQDLPLDFFVCFSGLSGVNGALTQVDYATANAFLDSYMHYRHTLVNQGLRSGNSCSIDWPYWQDGGMKINPQFAPLLTQTGLSPMPTAAGITAFYQAFSHSQTVVEYQQDHARMTDSSTYTEATETSSEITATPRFSNKTELSVQLRKDISYIAASLLGVDASDIDPDADLGDLGADSIVFISFINQLNKLYQLSLSPSLLFMHSTLNSILMHLLEQHETDLLASVTLLDNTDATQQNIADESHKQGQVTQRPAQVSASERIAIIGVSGEFPEAKDINTFWQNLSQGKDCVGPYTWPEVTNATGKQLPEQVNWLARVSRTQHFDPLFFNIAPAESKRIQLQESLLMMHVWKCIEDAGYDPTSLAGTNTGVFIGCQSNYSDGLLTSSAFAPNRMSFLLDLHGPSEGVDTTCSSSLVAIHKAIQSIQQGECTQAIVGGVNIIDSPNASIAMNDIGALSPSGRCKAFSANADGIVRGEGVGMMFIKKLSTSESDNDSIYGTILGSAVNHGGKSHGFTVPNAKAQTRLLTQAWQNANIDPTTLSYIECHGTGTSLGDPIEVEALKHAVSNSAVQHAQPCALGSVKSNIGHLEIAAGIAGIIKVLLQFKHKTLAPSLHVDTLNPYLALDNSPFYVQTEQATWHSKGNRRAAVSSFGISGVNAHIVLEEYLADEDPVELTYQTESHHMQQVAKPASLKINGEQLSGSAQSIVLLSATSEVALHAKIQTLYDFITASNHDTSNAVKSAQSYLTRLAYTLQVGRKHHPYRAAWIVSSVDGLSTQLLDTLSKITFGDFKASKVKNADKEKITDHDLITLINSGNLQAIAQFWLTAKQINWPTLYRERARPPMKMHLPTTPFIHPKELTVCDDTNIAPVSNTTNTPETPWLVLKNHWQHTPLACPTDWLLKLINVFKTQRVLFISQTTLEQTYLHELLNNTEPTHDVNNASIVSMLFDDIENSSARFTPETLPDVVFFIGQSADLNHVNRQLQPLYQFIQAIEPFDSQPIQLFYASFISEHCAAREDITALLRSYSLRSPKHQWTMVEFKTASVPKNDSQNWQSQLLKEFIAPVLTHSIDEQFNYVQYQGDRRFCAQLVKTDLSSKHVMTSNRDAKNLSSDSIQFKHNGTYLIVGALGELGKKLSQHLLTQYNAKLILLGRKSENDAQSDLKELTALPGNIHYLSCNIAVEQDMTRVAKIIKENHLTDSALNGLFHLGTAFSEQENNWKDFEQSMAVKVSGSQLLDAAFSDEPLDFFMLFSSMAVFGTLNHLSYSYGNGFQNTFATMRSTLVANNKRHGKTLAINWGYWHSDDALKRIENGFAEKKGYALITMCDAFDYMTTLLASEQSTLCVVMSHDKDKIYQNTCQRLKRVANKAKVPVNHQDVVTDSSQHNVADIVVNIIANVIGVTAEELELDCDLYEYGFDSISLLKTFQQLKTQLQIDIQADAFKNMNTIQALIDEIERIYQRNALNVNSDNSFVNDGTATIPDFILDAGVSLPNLADSQPIAFEADIKSVLLTGATGFLGSHILKQLLDSTDAIIYCLVRANTVKQAQQRVKQAAQSYRLAIDLHRIVPVLGDMEQPQLGLSKKNWAMLCKQVQHIVHTASYVNHIQPYFAFKKSVSGTNELLTIASTHTLKMIHFVSSTTVSTQVNNSHFSINPIEDFIDVDDAALICSGYGQSKWVQEENIRQASLTGVPYTIYRFSEISGSSATGIGNTDDIFHRILRMMLSVPARDDAASYLIDVIPVDKAAQSIVFGMNDTQKRNKVFNVANKTPLSIAAFYVYAEAHDLSFTNGDKANFIDACVEYVAKIKNEHEQIIMQGLLSSRPGYDEYLFETYLMPMDPYHKDNFLAFVDTYHVDFPQWDTLFNTYFKQWKKDKHYKVLWQ